MLQKIDTFFLHFFKRYILLLDFFGISRYWAGVVWILLSSASYAACVLDFKRGVVLALFSVIFWITGTIFISFRFIQNFIHEYDEDDIIAGKPWYQSIFFRLIVILGVLLIYFLIYLLLNLEMGKSWQNGSYFRCIANPIFYIYIVLNQNTRSKITLRNLIAVFKLRISNLANWRPQPLPQPAPNATFSGLP